MVALITWDMFLGLHYSLSREHWQTAVYTVKCFVRCSHNLTTKLYVSWSELVVYVTVCACLCQKTIHSMIIWDFNSPTSKSVPALKSYSLIILEFLQPQSNTNSIWKSNLLTWKYITNTWRNCASKGNILYPSVNM